MNGSAPPASAAYKHYLLYLPLFDLTDRLENRQQTLVLLLSNRCCPLHVVASRILRSLEFDGWELFSGCLFPIKFHPVSSARIFLDTALPVLAAPHSLPSAGFSFLHLSLLPTILDCTPLGPKCAQPAFCLNREEFHVSIRLPMHVDFL